MCYEVVIFGAEYPHSKERHSHDLEILIFELVLKDTDLNKISQNISCTYNKLNLGIRLQFLINHFLGGGLLLLIL